MADGAFSEKPKSKREQAVEKALDVLIAAGISAAIIGATWPEADEDGNKDVTAAHDPGQAAKRHRLTHFEVHSMRLVWKSAPALKSLSQRKVLVQQ